MPATDERDATLPGEPISAWFDDTPTTDYDPLDGDARADVAIVGGGIAGLSAAASLVERGRRVIVLERDRIVEGVTGRTTAKVTSQHGLVYDDLFDGFGRERARQYAAANEDAIDAVAERIGRFDADCAFERRPAYTYVDADDDGSRIEDEVAAARNLDLPASYEADPPLPFETGPAVRFDEQAQFHPRAYLLALAEDLDGGDCTIHERTRVRDVDGGDPCRVVTDRGTVTAGAVVLATHFPLLDRGLYFARMTPKRSYVIAFRAEGEPPEGMFYRPDTPYFSVRTHPTDSGRLVLVGGQNHKTGQGGSTAARYRRLAAAARDRLPVGEAVYRWSTQDYVPADKAPFVGRLPMADDVYVATGFRGWGMTNGTASGSIIAGLIVDGEHPHADAFDPGRLAPRGARTLVEHNAETAAKFVGDWVEKPRRHADVEALDPEEAAVVRDGTDMVAAYRDGDGTVHAVSAVCTHMRCLVEWNDAERSWDCPCHGSRFDPDGRVLDGPATADLPSVDGDRE